MDLCVKCNKEPYCYGRLGKECHKKYMKEYMAEYLKNPENRKKSRFYHAKYQIEWLKNPVNEEKSRLIDKIYQKNKRAVNPMWKSEENKKYRENNIDKVYAHKILHRALRNGEICKEPCMICNSEKAQAHHPNYSLPLLVKWLCPSHHKLEHLGRYITN